MPRSRRELTTGPSADEADLAAHCIAARAQADEMLRLARLNEHDPALAGRPNAEYRSTMRLWLAVYTRLKRVQAERRKRDANAETANEGAWARHIAERSMLAVLAAQPEAGPAEPVRPHQAPVAARALGPVKASLGVPVARPSVAPMAVSVAAPAACTNPAIKANISENKTNSHGMAFETLLSTQIPTPRFTGSRVENFRGMLLDTIHPFQQEAGAGHGPDGTLDLGHAGRHIPK